LIPANRSSDQPATTAPATADEAASSDDAADAPDPPQTETPESAENSGDPAPTDDTESR
jgi:hypothetical protein